MTRDVKLENRYTYVFVTDREPLLPAPNLYPDPELYPGDSGGSYIEANIVAGSMKLDEVLVDTELEFGNLYHDKFECTLYDVEQDLSGYYLYVYQDDNNVIKHIFSGVIESSKRDRMGGDRKVIAYSISTKYAEKNVADWWNNFWRVNSSATLLKLRTSLLEYYGILFEDVELPNDAIVLTKNAELSFLSFASMLRMICELNCCFPHFDREQQMRFFVLDDTAPATNIENLYEGSNSTFEDYSTDPITGVQFLDSDGKIKYFVGSQDNMYVVSKDNMLIHYMGTQQLTTIGDNMLSYIEGIHYTPSNVKMVVGDLSYNLGDKIYTQNGIFYIFQNSYSGTQLIEETMSAKGSKKFDTDKRALQTSTILLNEKVARLEMDVEHFETEFVDYKEETSTKFTQTAASITAEVNARSQADGQLSTRITQNATSISSEVSARKEGDRALSSTITQTASSITSTVTQQINTERNRAETAESNISQYAHSITLDVSNGSTSSTIKLKAGSAEIASKTIKMDGLVKFSNLEAAGETEINGDNITTGSITDKQGNTTFDLENGYLTMHNGEIVLGQNEKCKITSEGKFEGKDVHITGGEIIFTGTGGYTTATINSAGVYGFWVGVRDGTGHTHGHFVGGEQGNSIWLNQPGGSGADLYTYGTMYAADFRSSSDARLKDDIQDLDEEDAKDFIMALKPKSFEWKGKNPSLTDGRHHGFIAQDVQELSYDNWNVTSTTSGNLLALHYIEIIADLVSVVQQQEKRIQALEEALKGEKHE